jgi:hypothetical protein
VVQDRPFGDGPLPPPDLPPRLDVPPPPDVMTSAEQHLYRFITLHFDYPGVDQRTRFASFMNQLLPIALAGGVLASDPLELLVSLDTVTPGSSGVVITFCQGRPRADGTAECGPQSEPNLTTGSIDGAGNLVTDPIDFSFDIAFINASVPLTLRSLQLSGRLDPNADNGPGQPRGALTGGAFKATLGAFDLCNVTLQNDLLGTFCDGATVVNLLDMVDGPDQLCGQDASYGPDSCVSSADPTTHNVAVGGAFETSGSFDLEGAQY